MSIMDIENRVRFNKIKSRNHIEQDEHCDNADARRVIPVDEAGNPINASNRFPVDAIINVTEGDPVDTPTVFRVPVPIADAEYSQALPSRTKRFEIHTESRRGTIKLKLERSGTTTLEYTIKPGNTWESKPLDVSDLIVKFSLNKAGEKVEILVWT